MQNKMELFNPLETSATVLCRGREPATYTEVIVLQDF